MPTPVRIVPLLTDIGTSAGHRLVALSLEVYEEFADLRFARIDEGADRPLPRRVPAPGDWRITDPEGAGGYLVLDAVGRGDRSFSNGEVRFRPPPAAGSTVAVEVDLAPGEPALACRLDV